MTHPRCPSCGVFAAWNGYYGRWECSRCGRTIKPPKPTTTVERTGDLGAKLAEVSQTSRWYVVNHDDDDRVVRGPYATSEAAGAVRTELERHEQYDEANLWILCRA